MASTETETQVTFHHSMRSTPDASAVVAKGPDGEGHLYRWKAGDALSLIAVKYMRPSSDWKELFELNHKLFQVRHNKIQEGDLIVIPQDWLPLKSTHSFDATIVEVRNQDLQRESYILQMYQRLHKVKSEDLVDGN